MWIINKMEIGMPGRCLKLSVILAALCCGLTARPQNFGMSGLMEWQTDFHGKSAWVNMLHSEAVLVLGSGITASIGTISTCRTNKEQLIPNLLTYSNIEEENIPLALNRFGVSAERCGLRIFAGVGNVNDDFFATPVASLFTNSSCGIFPTVSANFGIANFPDASLGVEGKYETGGITVNSAIYNGMASHRFCGKESVFRFCPTSDGIFNINSINYRRNDDNYNMGCGVYSGGIIDDDNAAQEFSSAKAKTKIFYWFYAEQKIAGNLSMIAQYSQCQGIKDGCRSFGGAGLAYLTDRCGLGLYSCYAGFTDDKEWASELTFRYSVSPCVSLQSALHYIRNSLSNGPVGLFRMCLTL